MMVRMLSGTIEDKIERSEKKWERKKTNLVQDLLQIATAVCILHDDRRLVRLDQ